MGVFQNSYTVCGFEYVYNWIMQVGHWLINVPKSLYIQMSKNETDFYHHPVTTLGCNLRLSYHWTPFVPSDIGGDWNRSFPRFPSSFKFIKYTVTRWPHCPWSSDFPGEDLLGRTCSKSPAPNFTGNVWVPRRDWVLIWPKSWMKILLDGKSLGSGLYSSFKMQF